MQASPQAGTDNTAHAHTTVRAAILDGTLTPGQVVSQVQLAKQLNISRTPLREAIRLLQTEGLVVSDFNRRVRIAPLTITDLEQIYVMRIVLEPLGARLTIPRLGPDDLDEAEAAYEAMHAVTEAGDPRFRDPHRQFHLGFCGLEHDRLRAQIKLLWDHAERYRLLYQGAGRDLSELLSLAHREHHDLLAAARSGDAERCATELASHLGRTALTVMATLDPTHDPHRIRAALRQATGGVSPDPAR